MASFSDDEKPYEVDSILGERKRKGVLQYLVQWKSVDEDQAESSWVPAESIAADCAKAIKAFVKSKTRKRSVSKSRKTSRSRSRSASRSRKTVEKLPTRRSTRSSSRGRSTKIPVAQKKPEPEIVQAAAEEEKVEAVVSEPVEAISTPPSEALVTESTAAQSTETASTEAITTQSTETATVSTVETVSVTQTTTTDSSMPEKKASPPPPPSGRVTRSSTRAARENLEVQRVHNEQRPVHEDDSKPRSSVWKVADYAVIVLFVISVIAALFLFVEKFVDLEEFKPNFGTLLNRLSDGKNSLIDLLQSVLDKVSDLWLFVVDKIGGGSAPPTTK